ncbi:MAG: hypothetical protein ABI781_18900 [Burkholderiales bacterium]
MAQEYADFTAARSAKMIEDAEATFAVERNLLIGGCLLAFLLAAVAGVLITRNLACALGGEPAELGAAMGRIADGDLSVRIDVAKGDQSSVMAAAARMQAALSSVVGSVRSNSESVATASAQIAQGNQDLSGRTEDQASALQQTAVTTEQLGTTVRNNADSARQANQRRKAGAATGAGGGGVQALP